MGRVLIVGCGSIGSRRARLLAGMGHTILLHDTDDRRIVGVCADLRGADIVTARNLQLAELFDYGKSEVAFICTPAHTHVQLAMECVERGIPVFVEKPLSNSMDGIPELLEAVEKAGVVNMGACNMRWAYEPIPDDAEEIRFCSRQPLSQWGGNREAYARNGIILESAIHEMDVAVSQLGRIVGADWAGDTHGPTVIDLRHERGKSGITVDWDEYAPVERTVTWWTVAHAGGCHADISDRMYEREMAHFLDCVQHNKPTCNPLSNAAHVLDWALKLKEQVGVTA